MRKLLASLGVTAAVGLFSFGASGKPASGKPRVDYNFGCAAAAAGPTQSWTADGLDVPRGVASKFKLLKRVRTPAESGPGGCTKLPPMAVPIRPANGGNVQWVDFVMATEDVTVYRAFSNSTFDCSDPSPAQKFGAWWSLEKPQQKHIFRRDNAVCRQWNDFSELVACTLAAGTVIAVGPTQSAQCQQPKLGSTCKHALRNWPIGFVSNHHPQIFLNLRGRSAQDIGQFLKDCRVTTWQGRE